jgi:hypothetical protein
MTFSTDFSFQNLVLIIYLKFQQEKLLKIQYLSHLMFKTYEINFIKSCSSRSFKQYQKHIPIPLKISVVMV